MASVSVTMCNELPGTAVSDDMYMSVHRFLSYEADCLDRRAYREWRKLWTEDLHYLIKAQRSHDAADGVRDYVIIEEDATGLTARIEQIATPKLTHAENPPSFARRFFSGLRVAHGERDGELIASASILIYHSRPGRTEGSFYAGAREDTLRQTDGSWKLVRRFVRLDHAVLYGSASTIF